MPVSSATILFFCFWLIYLVLYSVAFNTEQQFLNIKRLNSKLTVFLFHCEVGWTHWSEWDACSFSGLQRRSRTCHNHLASAVSGNCEGDSNDFTICPNIIALIISVMCICIFSLLILSFRL